MSEAIYTRAGSVVKRSVAGEILLVPVAGQLADLQRVFVLDEVGSEIWDRLDGQRTLEQIEQELLEIFEVSGEALRADLQDFVGELQQAGLLARAAG